MRAPSLIGALAILAFSPIAAAGEGRPVNPEKAEELTSLVRQDCGSCHGLTLKGGLGRPITRTALEAFDVETLSEIVLHGIPGTPMPPWASILSREDADWIAEGLKKGSFE